MTNRLNDDIAQIVKYWHVIQRGAAGVVSAWASWIKKMGSLQNNWKTGLTKFARHIFAFYMRNFYDNLNLSKYSSSLGQRYSNELSALYFVLNCTLIHICCVSVCKRIRVCTNINVLYFDTKCDSIFDANSWSFKRFTPLINPKHFHFILLLSF